jgi:DNA-binding CsgD family transcriptional regulator
MGAARRPRSAVPKVARLVGEEAPQGRLGAGLFRWVGGPRRVGLQVVDSPGFEVIGRERELASVAAFVEASASASRAMVLEGETGVGKTTLWLAGVEVARGRGHWVLESRPAAAEARLAFAGLGDLLGGVLAEVLERLPAPQADALRVALLLEQGGVPPNERAVAVAVLSALRALCAVRPVLLAVDDVQWLDSPSAAVLAFAWRRLREERAGLLVASRAGEAGPGSLVGDERVERLGVGPLSVGAVHRLLHVRLGLVLARPALLRLHEVAAGNAFFALELGRAFERREATLAEGRLPPVPERLRELVRERLAVLPAATREALAAAAALSRPTLALVAAAAGAEASVRPALAARVVGLEGDRLRFSHPLLAAAAYEDLDALTRRDLHRRLAALVDDEEERAGHLALAASGPNEEVAGALERAAEHARRRGASAAAAELCERARRLTPTNAGADAHRRMVAGARYRFAAGDTAGARTLLERALAGDSPGPLAAEALVALSLVHLYEGDQPKAAALAQAALAETGAPDRVRAEAAMCLASALLFLREDLQRAHGHAGRAAQLAARAGDVSLRANSLGTKALIECQLGRSEAEDTLHAAAALADAQPDERVLAWPAYQHATFLLWTDGAPDALTMLRGLQEQARARGDESATPVILAYVALADYLLGRWPDAARVAEEGYQLALQTGQRPHQALALSERALVRASLGREAEARADAERALAFAGERGMMVARIHSAWALGLLELSLDRPLEAAQQLAPLRQRLLAAGVGEPGAIRFVPDEIQALLALGRPDAAEPLLDWLERRGRSLRRASALAAAGRCRGLLAAAHGDDEAALAAYERALAAHDQVWMPFDRARTVLALGATHRRAKRRSAARDALGQALAEFERLGAALWAQRAQTEIDRIGGRAPARAGLTPTQRRLAELAAEGRSNKEIAAALFITPKTDHTQLSRIYGKLGVHSRTALAHRLRSEAETRKE